MKIISKNDIDIVNAKFNGFHDGFVKQIRVSSDNDFLTDMPWEKQRQFATIEEELRETGLCYMQSNNIEIEIHHYNYDYPNQPRKRAIILQATSAQISGELLDFLGEAIFDLTFSMDSSNISCVLTYHKDDIGPTHSMENGETMVLFSAKEIELNETTWTEHGG